VVPPLPAPSPAPPAERVGFARGRSWPARPRLAGDRLSAPLVLPCVPRFDAVRFVPAPAPRGAGPRFAVPRAAADLFAPVVPPFLAAPFAPPAARFAADLFVAEAFPVGAARFAVARFGVVRFDVARFPPPAARSVPAAAPSPSAAPRDRDRGLGVSGREAADRPLGCFFPVVRSVCMFVPSALSGLVLRCRSSPREVTSTPIVTAGSQRSKRGSSPSSVARSRSGEAPSRGARRASPRAVCVALLARAGLS
jgi:hypothetical protein